MNSTMHFRLPGYGLGQGGQQVMQATGQTLISAGAVIPVAGPFVALAGAVTDLLASVGVGKGCGQTCITASNYANQAETLLKQNLSAYMALPSPRPQSAQQAAMNNFQQIWNGLVTACAGVPGTAGQNCVADRQQGACKWKDSSGNCWNWFIGYRDPIANDKTNNDAVGAVMAGTSGAATAAATAAAATSPVSAGVGGDSSVLWIGAALVAGLLLVSFS